MRKKCSHFLCPHKILYTTNDQIKTVGVICLKDIKRIFLIAGTYVATVIGAGFASGQEILSYFAVYGKRSIYGLAIVCVLFILCAMCVMLRIYKDDIGGFDEYMSVVSGKRMGIFIRICVTLFMFATFCSMAAGSGELAYDIFKDGRVYGIAAMLIMCTIVFLFDLKGILAVNAVLAPIMAVSLFTLGLYTFIFRDTAVFAQGIASKLCDNYVTSALIYASYNILTAIVILAQMRPVISRRRVCIFSSVLGGGALFVIALAIWGSISLYYGMIPLGEMPFLTIVARRGNFLRMLYSAALYFSMLTTAISCGYGVIERLKSVFGIKKLTAVIILIAASCPVLTLGFSDIVKNVYSVFGYMGLALIVYVLADGVRMMGEK